MPSATYEVQPQSQPSVYVNLSASQQRRESNAQRRRIWLCMLVLVLCLALFAVGVGIAIAVFGSLKRSAGANSTSASLSPSTADKDSLASMTLRDGLSPSSLDRNTCKKPACLDYAAELLQTMDLSSSPCHNFNQFVCARKKAQKSLKSVVNSLQDALQTTENTDSPFAHMFKTLYHDCMTAGPLERSGIQPLLNLITRLGGCTLIRGTNFDQTSYQWEKQSTSLSMLGIHPLIAIGLTAIKNEAGETLKYVHLKIEAPEREESPSWADIHEKVVRFMRLLGQSLDESLVDEMVEFARHVYETIAPPPPTETVTLTYEELKTSTVGIDWNELLDGVFDFAELELLDDEELLFIGDFTYLRNVGRLIAATPKRIVANYLMWSLVDSLQTWLPLQYRTVLDSKVRQAEENRPEQCIVEFLSNTPGFLRSFILNDVWSEDTGYNALAFAGELTDDENSHSVLVADRAGIRRQRTLTAPVIWTDSMTALERWVAVLQEQTISSLKTVRTLAIKPTDGPSAAFLLRAHPILQDDVPAYLRYGVLGPLVRCRILTEASPIHCLESIMQIYDEKHSQLVEKTLPGFQTFSAPQIILLLFANHRCDDKVRPTYDLQHLVHHAFSCH